MNIKESIKKLQELPEVRKKVIFFTIMIISTLIMGAFTVKSTINNLAKIEESVKSVDLSEMGMPKLQIDTPDNGINNININKLEENKLEIQDQNIYQENQP